MERDNLLSQETDGIVECESCLNQLSMCTQTTNWLQLQMQQIQPNTARFRLLPLESFAVLHQSRIIRLIVGTNVWNTHIQKTNPIIQTDKQKLISQTHKFFLLWSEVGPNISLISMQS